jgi:ribose/xylose/arabinose/galactoside ABC-type transport system permease subunit
VVDQIQQDLAVGHDAFTAIVESAVRRFRPITLTAAADVLALILLAREVFRAPIALAMLAGYAGKAYQAMGDPYLLPAIAAVVLGGTSILGGRGTYLGTVAGVILITVLESILSVMQISDSVRQIIYGAMIIVMMLVYGRDRRADG